MRATPYVSSARILVVDDSATNLRFISEILSPYYKVHASPSGEFAMRFLEKNILDLILLDLEMPGMSGYDMIRLLKLDTRWSSIPVIFLTAQDNRESELTAFELGAVDYILKPISSGVVLARVGIHLELEMHRHNLERMVELKTKQLGITQDAILSMLSNVASHRDNETGAHIKRTTNYVSAIIDRLENVKRPGYIMSREYAHNTVKSAKLHDIGKVAIPDGILLKQGELTEGEFDIIRQHPELGAKIIDETIEDLGDASSFLTVAREIIMAHHEKWQGNGYPRGLSGEDIPLSGRIMAIADVYDALISQRPYKPAMTHEQAMDVISSDTGTHFDPVLIEICKPVFDEFPSIAAKYRDEHDIDDTIH
ncbi:MAG: response regulator [Oscillospiraceae bacterium]|nr:response regulator [Oscillospiraceae bacterium]